MLFADPTDEEEALLTGIVTIVVTDDEKIGAVHKPGESLSFPCFFRCTCQKVLVPFFVGS